MSEQLREMAVEAIKEYEALGRKYCALPTIGGVVLAVHEARVKIYGSAADNPQAELIRRVTIELAPFGIDYEHDGESDPVADLNGHKERLGTTLGEVEKSVKKFAGQEWLEPVFDTIGDLRTNIDDLGVDEDHGYAPIP